MSRDFFCHEVVISATGHLSVASMSRNAVCLAYEIIITIRSCAYASISSVIFESKNCSRSLVVMYPPNLLISSNYYYYY